MHNKNQKHIRRSQSMILMYNSLKKKNQNLIYNTAYHCETIIHAWKMRITMSDLRWIPTYKYNGKQKHKLTINHMPDFTKNANT